MKIYMIFKNWWAEGGYASTAEKCFRDKAKAEASLDSLVTELKESTQKVLDRALLRKEYDPSDYDFVIAQSNNRLHDRDRYEYHDDGTATNLGPVPIYEIVEFETED